MAQDSGDFSVLCVQCRSTRRAGATESALLAKIGRQSGGINVAGNPLAFIPIGRGTTPQTGHITMPPDGGGHVRLGYCHIPRHDVVKLSPFSSGTREVSLRQIDMLKACLD
jgi:hypothetical protein